MDPDKRTDEIRREQHVEHVEQMMRPPAPAVVFTRPERVAVIIVFDADGSIKGAGLDVGGDIEKAKQQAQIMMAQQPGIVACAEIYERKGPH